MIRFFEIIKKYRTSLCLILLLLACMVIVPSMAKYAEKDISAGEFNLNVVQNKHVFAVYGDYTSNGTTVKALNFYNRQLVSKGDTITLLDGSKQKVDTIYTGFEVGNNVAPWYNNVNYIKVSRVVDDGIAPESTKYWYKDCENVVDIDLLKLDTSKVTDMSYMFSFDGDAGAVCKYLNLSSFDTSNVTNMSYMFGASEAGTHSLETIIVSDKWNMNKVTESNNMFLLDQHLVGGSGTEYDSTIIDAAYARIDGGSEHPGYFTYYKYALVFDANGGSGAPDVLLSDNGSFTIPSGAGTVSSEGYSLLGWATTPDATEAECLPGVTYTISGVAPCCDKLYAVYDKPLIVTNPTEFYAAADSGKDFIVEGGTYTYMEVDSQSTGINITIHNAICKNFFYTSSNNNVVIDGFDFTSSGTTTLISVGNFTTVTVNDAKTGSNNGAFANLGRNSTLIINGGTYARVALARGNNTNSKLRINGGTFTGVETLNALVGDIEDVQITGGTFKFDPTSSGYIVEGHIAVDNGNGTWTVQPIA